MNSKFDDALIRGTDRDLLRKAIQNLSDLYQAWGRPDQVGQWKKRVEEFDRSQPTR